MGQKTEEGEIDPFVPTHFLNWGHLTSARTGIHTISSPGSQALGTENKLRQQLSWVSCLQVVDHRISQPP